MYNVMLSLACVAWRFFRARCTSDEAAGKIKTPAQISSRFLCPRLPLLLSAPNQNRHATQAIPSAAFNRGRRLIDHFRYIKIHNWLRGLGE